MPHPENRPNGTHAAPTERTHLLAESNGVAHPSTTTTNGSPNHHIKKWGEDDRRAYVRYPLGIAHTTWMTLASNYVNVLLVFVPLGIIAGVLEWSPTWVFVLVRPPDLWCGVPRRRSVC